MPWVIGGAIYIFGAVMYALRMPEKFFPEKFDLFGASHNIHHLTVMIGFTVHFTESVRLYYASKDFVCPIAVPQVK